jgi:acyltransferase
MYANGKAGRCIWIDAARGIGISLVVAGHMDIPKPLMAYIYCFHLPLFFFLSGLLHRPRRVAELATRRVRTLLVPYLLFSGVGLAVYGLMGVYPLADYPHELAGIVYGTASGPYRTPLTPLWFLLCLFTTEVVFAWIVAVAGGRSIRVFAAVSMLAAVGFINSKSARLVLPWGMSTSLVALLFFGLGAWSSRVASRLRAMDDAAKAGAMVLLGAIVWLAVRMNARGNMAYNSYDRVPIFLLGSVAGIGMTVLLAMLAESLWHGSTRPQAAGASGGLMGRLPGALGTALVTGLLYLGRNTLIILPMHIVASRFAIYCLTELPLRPGSTPNEVVEKSLTLMLLLGSVGLFRRCPLVIPRVQPGTGEGLQHAYLGGRTAGDALTSCPSRRIARASGRS